jgi:subtilisin family serine protease
MEKVDPALRFLGEQTRAQLRTLADESEFELTAAPREEPKASILVEFDGDLSELESAGLEVRSVAGDVASGEIQLGRVDKLAELDSVVRLEVSRALYAELDLALPESGADIVHTGPPGHRGANVIVGIIDSGIDFTHEAFRRSDGTTRILAIWDQGLAPQAGETAPAAFGYGVEYRQADIDAALVAPNPLAVVRHQDQQIPGDGFHGTHVAGIAAGDGSVAGQGQPAFTFVGVAPEADIVVVANTRGRATGERGLGDSADTLDAVRYIFDLAASLGRPAVINQSQGDNVGPHDGTSVLERGIDNLLGGTGRAMVKSAGNEGARNRHASGTVPATGTQAVQFTVPVNRAFPVTLDLWYDGAERIDFAITPPGGAATAFVTPGSTTTFNLPNGNQVFVASDLNDPANNDNRIFVVISRGTAGAIQSGTWSFTLQGTTVVTGQWDAWIQRGEPSPQFLAPFRNPARTISVPGTSAELITAASYVTRGAGLGSISTFSSLGPTRDGRAAPTVAAPGQTLMAPQPVSTGDSYGLMQGTSMAAPMVTGTVALMLQRSPSLTQARIKRCLEATARTDAFTGTTPNNAWGAGKLDADQAFACARPRPIPTITPPCRPPRTIRPPCRTVLPPCRPPRTVLPPCRTLLPPCRPPRTVLPPCPTVVPPCPRTLGPPCPPRTVGPTCPRPTLAPLCPQPTLGPGCPQPTLAPASCPQPTLGPGCPQPTLGPGCPQPTLAPGCPQPTLGPACGAGPRGPAGLEGEITSGGWGPPESAWGEWGYEAPEWADSTGWEEPSWEGWPPDEADEELEEPDSAAELETQNLSTASDTGASATEYWYGNPGY